MAILAPTDLPDARMNRTLGCGGDPRFERHVETIDDLMIVVAVVEIDGSLGTLGRAGPCWVRTATSLPLYGRISMDAADFDQLQARDLEEVIVHEMGHVLGFGTLWPRVGLLRDPASETSAPDTHFTGPLAIAAFDEADLARAIEAAPKIPYGDDIWTGPLIFVDPNGRITRVIPR